MASVPKMWFPTLNLQALPLIKQSNQPMANYSCNWPQIISKKDLGAYQGTKPF